MDTEAGPASLIARLYHQTNVRGVVSTINRALETAGTTEHATELMAVSRDTAESVLVEYLREDESYGMAVIWDSGEVELSNDSASERAAPTANRVLRMARKNTHSLEARQPEKRGDTEEEFA